MERYKKQKKFTFRWQTLPELSSKKYVPELRKNYAQ
jgi:hypothetical protein